MRHLALSGWRFLLFLGVVLSVSACVRPLAVDGYFLKGKDLASHFAKTPDPTWDAEYAEKHLIVSWNLPKDRFRALQEPEVLLHMRFGNGEDQTVRFPLTRYRGKAEAILAGEQYKLKKGIASYAAEIVSAGRVIESWHHLLWVERIDVKYQPVPDALSS